MSSSLRSLVHGLTLATIALSLPLAAAADTLTWTGNLTVGASYQRPTEDGQAIADQGPVRYQAASIFVDRTGVYTLTSDTRVFLDEIWDGFLALYAAPFAPGQPLANFVAADDEGPEGFGTSQITTTLVAGVIYRVVTSTAEGPAAQFNFVNTITGPGNVRRSACFRVGDEFLHFDDESEISLLGEIYCPTIRFRDAQGGEGLARPVPLRSNESALFWIYHPDNWEVQVKVLDACVINGHRWVFISGTTDVELEIEVFESQNFRSRTYEKPLGEPMRAILDTAAFSCDEAPPPTDL